MSTFEVGDKVKIKKSSEYIYPVLKNGEAVTIKIVGLGDLKGFYWIEKKGELILISSAYLEKIDEQGNDKTAA